MNTQGTLRLATRGSTLARRQARIVTDALEQRRYEVELVPVETTGDQLRDELIHRLGKTGAFVRELDERVLEGDCDGAIHSMKDMPTDQPDELVTAAVPERGPPGDVLVTPDGSSLDELPREAVVGTSSLRRRAQLLSERSDLTVEPLRGNVDTRIEKLLAPALQAEHEERMAAEERHESVEDTAYGQSVDDWFDGLSEVERLALGREVETAYDAIVLAEAGLERSGLAPDLEYVRLSHHEFVPAPGQGALAVTAVDGERARELNEALDHPRSRVEVTVERTILAELGGGCIAPIGVHAVVQGEYVHATVQVFDRDGEQSVSATRDLPVESHPDAARTFAADLAERGAAELIEAASRESDDDASGASRSGAPGDGERDDLPEEMDEEGV